MIHNQRDVESIETIIFQKRKTISELFQITSDANLEVEKYCTCKVMVLSIDMNNQFYYKSCIVRKLVEIGSKFYCASYSKDVDYPKAFQCYVIHINNSRHINIYECVYMLNVLASDKTGSAWFVLFDKEVKNVIGNDIEAADVKML
ncbi:hypothetical protein M9H77_22992 [Catharanthus roseus]|uniref:Uncharacterized protein n=1 Tax=Catharanthus roseus TaxID=4058 RepID=A0ACC0AS04_CATRO|nr:hypothetical protein M9H77_22992 [Catharanthus roseus]